MGWSLKRKILASIFGASLVGGCGTYVPDVLEFWAGPDDLGIKVNSIASQVKCELEEAVRDRISRDRALRPRHLAWLETWGAQVTLSFVIDEKTLFNPGATLKTPLQNAIVPFPTGGNLTIGQNFSLGLGLTTSAGATRTSKVIMLFSFAEMLKRGVRPSDRTCLPDPVNGDLFVTSRLKLKEWLYAATFTQFTGIGQLIPKDAITHQIKYTIVSNGGVTPTWTLVRVNAGSSSSLPLFGANRERTQDLTITLGPVVQGIGSPPALATAAQNSHLASEIGNAVAAGIKSITP
jgi:hypothetical protein